jgi:hypothetical protein
VAVAAKRRRRRVGGVAGGVAGGWRNGGGRWRRLFSLFRSLPVWCRVAFAMVLLGSRCTCAEQSRLRSYFCL